METQVFCGYLSQILRSARLRAKLTQVELASRAGVTRRYIQSIENGKQEASISTLFSLAVALDTSPALLVKELEDAVLHGNLSAALRDAPKKSKPGRPKKDISK